MGETRVDLLHLLEDLRDAYPGSLEETILTEIVANALDSAASHLDFVIDPSAVTLTVVDDGRGMTRRELARYHDLAASGKQRGRGIGFAGVGIKLGLLACDEVITETRRDGKVFATAWHLKSRHRAPWRWTDPISVAVTRGTAVRLRLANTLSPLLDAGFLEGTIRRHFAPLFDAQFSDILQPYYPKGVAFAIDGRAIEPVREADSDGNGAERQPIAVRLPRHRKVAGFGVLVRSGSPEPGLSVSTLGKVIRHGWEWLGIAPAQPDRVSGLIEVPALAETLTLNKADFLRTGPRGAVFLAYRKAIQEVVANQLAVWGDAPDVEPRRRSARPVERDMEGVLAGLAHEFPLLATLIDRRPGGQRRLALESKPGNGNSGARVSAAPEGVVPGVTEGSPPEAPEQDSPPSGRAPAAIPEAPVEAGGSRPGRKRPAHYGLRIEFESRPDDQSLGRLVESTVWVNEAHPAWRRAKASRAEGYHLALTVAMSLASIAVEPQRVHQFVESFMERWGDTESRRGKRR